jgi:hypothetical protein
MPMARRRATKAGSKSASAEKRPVGAKIGRARPTGVSNGSMQERLAALERERDQLREELERFKVRQRRLEETQAQVRDRLAWALDSLHNILEGKG